jgi:hypothetical protein
MDSADRSTRIFLRDDDVTVLSQPFRRFFDLFAERGLPMSYQIIPERFTSECADFLRAAQASAPKLVDLGQHGLRHQMMVRDKLEFYEFGPERTYRQQLDDILEGRALLRSRLGNDVPLDVFTPPRHRYDRNTLTAIKEAGFSVLSASSYTSLRHRGAYAVGRALGLTNLGRPGVPRHGSVRPDSGLFELSVAVGIDDGGAVTLSVDDAMREIARARRHTQDVGVLFHHEAFKGDEGSAYLQALTARLRELPDVRFHTIGDLYDRLNSQRR